jgi:hypothetical protein
MPSIAEATLSPRRPGHTLRHARLLAVVERKSFDNILSDLGAIQALHHTLADLSRVERSALVVEAQYGDFLNEKRLEASGRHHMWRGRWRSCR